LCLMIGELICFKSARQPGVAGLERRRPARYIEWPLVALVSLTIIAIVGFIVWRWQGTSVGYVNTITMTAGTPNSGTLTISMVTDNSVQVMAQILLAATVLALVVIVLVTRRPRNGADPTLAALDDVLRRRSQRIAMVALFGAIIVSLGIGLGTQTPAQSTDTSTNNVTVITLPSGGGCVTPYVPYDNSTVICSEGTDDVGSVTYTYSINVPQSQPSELPNILAILAVAALMLALIAAAALPPKTSPLKPEDAEEEAAEDAAIIEVPTKDETPPTDDDTDVGKDELEGKAVAK